MIKMALIDLLEMILIDRCFQQSAQFRHRSIVPENGVSQLFFSKQKQAVNQEAYFRNCIKARLIPFIQRFHTKEKVLFWPDLATNHYSHKVMDYLDDNEVQMVHKEWNPQNCPESRAIETL
ncbi:unnamed protein product [Rotaria socialis]|uniref:Transposase n=1 Tax=Rotaria socialis TaxID=392032 RepID=A0A820NLN0_9BILA|nr:unnamed protein product [Rotaria socialis]